MSSYAMPEGRGRGPDLSRRAWRRTVTTMGVSDLTAVLAQQGAVPVDDRGVTLPRHFGDPAAEYAALREGATLLHLGHRTVVSAHGADRAEFLQGMLTNEVAGLRPGQGCGALLLTIQGR